MLMLLPVASYNMDHKTETDFECGTYSIITSTYVQEKNFSSNLAIFLHEARDGFYENERPIFSMIIFGIILFQLFVQF